MEHADIWQEVIKWVLGVIGAAGAYFGKRAIGKYDVLNAHVAELDKRLLIQDKAMIESKLEATKTFVDKIDYVRMENKMDSIASTLNNKIDKVADNVQELVNKLLTNS